MSKTATIRARIEPDLKMQAEDVLQGLGLSSTQAITLLYRQLVLQRRLPFDLALPNAVTLETFRKTDAGEDLVPLDDLAALEVEEQQPEPARPKDASELLALSGIGKSGLRDLGRRHDDYLAEDLER